MKKLLAMAALTACAAPLWAATPVVQASRMSGASARINGVSWATSLSKHSRRASSKKLLRRVQRRDDLLLQTSARLS